MTRIDLPPLLKRSTDAELVRLACDFRPRSNAELLAIREHYDVSAWLRALANEIDSTVMRQEIACELMRRTLRRARRKLRAIKHS